MVELIELVRSGPVLGVVLEYVDGPHLGEWARRDGSLTQAREVLLGALAGLGYAHSMGFIHRDLKPENILLQKTPNGLSTKLADFGLAKSYESSGMSLMDIAGTPPYWPREHLTHYNDLYPASDVFSIAAVFYWALSGTHARAGMSDLLRKQKRPGYGEYVSAIMNGKLIPLREPAPDIPAAVAAVLDKALCEKELDLQGLKKNAARQLFSDLRYPNAGAFRDALKLAFDNCGITE